MSDPLRDKAHNTRLLALRRLQKGATLSEVAKAMGVTVQAISAHAKTMVGLGWLAATERGPVVTPAGMQQLHEGVRRLRLAVDALEADLSVIHAASAVAGAPIRAGTQVALVMVQGDLVAQPGTGPSSGLARNDASAGDEVVVDELRGMVDMHPGSIDVVTVPGPAEGGANGVNLERLARRISESKPDLVSAVGTGAAIVARRLGRLDLPFAAEHAAANAAQRGLNVMLLVSRDRLAVIAHLDGRLQVSEA